MRCSHLIKQKPKRTRDGSLYTPGPHRCKKMAKRFFSVQYSELEGWRDNGKWEGTFGFCPDCAPKFVKKDAWVFGMFHSQGTVERLRGPISSVKEVAQEDAQDDRHGEEVAYVKTRILTIMRQKNMRKLCDSWETIFREVLEEFTVEQVMKG